MTRSRIVFSTPVAETDLQRIAAHNGDHTSPFGQPGVLELGLRMHIGSLIRALLPSGNLDPAKDVDVGAGAKCVVVELFKDPSAVQMQYLQDTCARNTPDGYTTFIIDSYTATPP